MKVTAVAGAAAPARATAVAGAAVPERVAAVAGDASHVSIPKLLSEVFTVTGRRDIPRCHPKNLKMPRKRPDTALWSVRYHPLPRHQFQCDWVNVVPETFSWDFAVPLQTNDVEKKTIVNTEKFMFESIYPESLVSIFGFQNTQDESHPSEDSYFSFHGCAGHQMGCDIEVKPFRHKSE